MPRFKHVVQAEYKPTFRSEKVASMFDVPVESKLCKEWTVDIPIEAKPWKIGLIVGASGSGKTTIAKRLFDKKLHEGFQWAQSCMLDDFPRKAEVRDITETLSRVGFSSPPSWLLPYHVLSNGQKFRAELARCLLEYDGLFVFDEFTSVVDRQVAQVSAHAFQKAVRKSDKQFVAVTCHYDVEQWLEPDWVFDVSENTFKWGSLRRPQIEIEIFRTSYQTWQIFKDHHYLSSTINKAAVCFVGCIEGRPVVFDSWLPFVGRLSHGKAMRDHRRVCLPDFQGLGLGQAVFTETVRMWSALGYRVFSGTSHPAEVQKRSKNKDWILTRQGRTASEGKKVAGGRVVDSMKHATNRLTAGFEWVGDKMPLGEAIKLLAR